MPKIIATREDWIKLGYKQFAEKGISGIIIEHMAKQLSVNKSSFYWHFRTKKIFVEAIVEYWEKESTSKIIALVQQEELPENQLAKLIALSFKKDRELDFFFYLKKYAKSNRALESKIQSLDEERLAFTANILRQMGYSESDSIDKSGIFYKYLIGYHEMIRYKRQNPDYVQEVKKELNHFIKF